jgi:4-hydroxy-3-polyprenylbenzoate decarboxylase
VVVPASPSFYTRPRSVEQLLDTVLARVFDHIGISHSLLARWGEPQATADDPFSKEI